MHPIDARAVSDSITEPTLRIAGRALMGIDLGGEAGRIAPAMLAPSFRLRLVPGARVEPRPMLSLRPRDGLPMTLHHVWPADSWEHLE